MIDPLEAKKNKYTSQIIKELNDFKNVFKCICKFSETNQ